MSTLPVARITRSATASLSTGANILSSDVDLNNVIVNNVNPEIKEGDENPPLDDSHSHSPSNSPLHIPSFSLNPDPVGPVVPVEKCGIYIEELEGKYSLGITSPCLACKNPVFLHKRDPRVGVLPPSSVPSIVPSIPVLIPTPRYTDFSKVSPLLEKIKWTSTTVCRTLFKQLENVLENNDIDPLKWTRSFRILMSENTQSVEWINKHIIDPNLPWKQACNLFSIHFQSADLTFTLKREFDALKQIKGQTVQAYADKFCDYVVQLNEPDNGSTIYKFTSNLLPYIHRAYLFRVDDRTDADPNFSISSLDQVVKICIKLDVINRTVNEAFHSSSSVADKIEEKKSSKLHCKEHPNASNHSYENCNKNPKNKGKVVPNSTSSGAGNTKSGEGGPNGGPAFHTKAASAGGMDTTRICFNCGDPNHIAPTCNKPHDPNSRFRPKKPVGVVSTLDITLPESVIICSVDHPSPDKKLPIFLTCNGRTYSTLVDTGATISIVDSVVASELGFKVNPLSGTLSLPDSLTTRIGKTDRVELIASFPGSEIAPKVIRYAFEVMNLRSTNYKFILGNDLLGAIFPYSIPRNYTPVDHNPVPAGTVMSVAPLPLPDNAEASLLEMIPNERLLVSTINLISEDISPTTLVSSQLLGIPTVPWSVDPITNLPTPFPPPSLSDSEDLPARLELSTADSVKAEYESKRQALAADPELIRALAANDAITGFCSLPDSFLRLEVASEKRVNLYRSQYNIAHSLKLKADPIIDRWLASGKIVKVPTLCRYNNPITIAPKKDANGDYTDVRVCLDTRVLNENLDCGDNFQLPYIRTALEIFSGCSIFGEFDLADAYLQFKLSEESRPYTAFQWNGQQYMFVGCPFGINLLPSFFQRIMADLFHDLPFTFPYLDNLPIASRTWEEHRDHLLIIIDRLTKANLRIKPSSVKFGHSQMRCLGHILSIHGIGIDPKKLSAIMDWELPTTGKELQSFLGMVTYVRQHIRHIAELTAPLEAIKNDKTVVWTDLLKHHFELIKKAICHAPFLKLPDYTRPFFIATDASNTGVGGVLYQPGPGDNDDITSGNIVAICSKKLSESQRNYSAYKKELFGIVYSLKQFHCYVWGRTDLVIVTDHKPLTYMLKSPDLSEALRRWFDTILDYKFTIRHRAGLLNVVPDSLSRMFGTVYEHSPTWGVSTAALITHTLAELKVVDSSNNDPPSGSIGAVSSPVTNTTFVAPSGIPGAGLGLFANQAFKGPKKNKRSKSPGQFITEYSGKLLVVGLDEFDIDETYLVKISDVFYLDGSEVDSSSTGLGRFANRPVPPQKPNARFSVNKDTLTVSLVATRSIAKGSEIFVSYNRALKHDINAVAVLAASLGDRLTLDGPYAFFSTPEGCPCGSETHEQEHKHTTTHELKLEVAPLSLENSSPTPSFSFSPAQESQLILDMETRGKIIPPAADRDDFIEQEHDFGHFGRDALYSKLLHRGYWWPGMRDAIAKKLSECDACTRYVVTKSGFHPARSITALGPMDHIQIDCSVHLPPDAKGFTTLLVIIDVFTGFVFLRAIKTTSAECVAHSLWELFATFGLPKIIQSDNGPEFVNKIVAALVKLTGVEHRFISPYNPRADGKVERAIGTLMGIIKKLLHGHNKEWSLYVPFAQLAFNSKISTLTNSTPFSLMFARTLNPFKDYSSTNVDTPLIDFNDWKTYQEKVMSLIYPAISGAVGVKKAAMVERLNKHRKQLVADSFPAGAIVMLNDPLRSDKFRTEVHWSLHRDFAVLAGVPTNSVMLLVITLDRSVPADQLKLISRKPRASDLTSEVFRVEKILSHRGTPGHYEYLTKWFGYTETTWTPAGNFLDDGCIKTYWKSHPTSSSSTSSSH